MWWGVRVYPVAVAMYSNVVVVPTERGKVDGVVTAAVGETADVVRFKPVTRAAAIYDTYSITVRHGMSDSGWDCAGSWCGDYGYAISVEANNLDPATTLDLVQRVWSDPGPVLNDSPCFAGVVLSCIDEYGHLATRRLDT